MKITTRDQWGARHPDGFAPAALPAAEVWLHHSVTLAPDLAWVDADGDRVDDDETAAMRLLEQIGQDRFGGGFSYTFAVMPSGRVYEGHSIGRRGAHTKGRNSIARAIVLVGDYDRHRPTPAQLRTVAELLVHGHRAGWWRQPRLAGGHQDAPGASTACPGRHAQAAIPVINQAAQQLTTQAPNRRKAPTMFVALNGRSKRRLVTGDRIIGISQELFDSLRAAGVPYVPLTTEDLETLQSALVAENCEA